MLVGPTGQPLQNPNQGQPQQVPVVGCKLCGSLIMDQNLHITFHNSILTRGLEKRHLQGQPNATKSL